MLTCLAPITSLKCILNALGDIVSQLDPNDPLIIVGDLNCHLGHLGGVRSDEEPNNRGVLRKTPLIVTPCLLSPWVLLLVTPSTLIYHSNLFSTSLDYIIGSTALLLSCSMLEDHPLNTSDNLPVLAKCSFSTLSRSHHS